MWEKEPYQARMYDMLLLLPMAQHIVVCCSFPPLFRAV